MYDPQLPRSGVYDNSYVKNAPTTRKENQIAQLSIVCAHSPPLTYLSKAGTRQLHIGRTIINPDRQT